MLFQQGPAETTNFMIMGFVVIFGVMALHVWSLNSRRKNLEKDIELIEELNKEKS